MRAVLRPEARLTSLFRRLRRSPVSRATAHSGELQVDFRCNICGASNRVAFAALQRERPSCAKCRSTVRERAIVHLLTSELLGRSTALPDLQRRLPFRGIGLSDSRKYAKPLARKFAYTNTRFDARPILDITNVAPEHDARYDFMIASDVFEHVAPPVERAFSNARRMLKPAGVLIFTVPFTLEPDTIEHFPLLHKYRVYKTRDGWRLENCDATGRVHVHDRLVFHGGPGSTLEMRLFSRAALEREFAKAGFARVYVAGEACPEFGIEWPEPWSLPMVAHA
jgi:SAM-dependent methyltransferase